ncbi:MAG: sugar phosphate isomerase/epimerase [Defluviitaleaceae bacterium]|nr:sugar phosphate isomerase/epimerase [Defluviitaleaceae bacterium]
MRIGMRGHDLGKLPLVDFAKKVRDTGVAEIQLALNKAISDYDFSYGQFSPGMAAHIREVLTENGIRVPVLGSYIEPVIPADGPRQAEIRRFIENIRYAKFIGADMVGTETGHFNNRGRHNPALTRTESAYRLLCKTMSELLTAAENMGVMLAVEGVTVHTLYCPEIIKRFVDDMASQNLLIIFDACNLLDHTNADRQEELFDDVFTLFGDRIAALHLKDFVIEGDKKREVPIGEGILDYPALFKRIKAHKPHISALIEGGRAETFALNKKYLLEIFENA